MSKDEAGMDVELTVRVPDGDQSFVISETMTRLLMCFAFQDHSTIPTWISLTYPLMSSEGSPNSNVDAPISTQARNRRQVHQQRAVSLTQNLLTDSQYDIQFEGGIRVSVVTLLASAFTRSSQGAIAWTIGGAVLCSIAHFTWPLFRYRS